MEGKGGEVHKKSDFGSKFKKQELDFRPWHCGRQEGEVQIKSWNLDHGIVEGRGGSANKELDSTSWHCGRQGEVK